MIPPPPASIRVHRFLPLTEAEGPGKRACLWVQGCALRCPGCFNRETWDFRSGSLKTAHDLFCLVAEQPGIEGVTFVGGEPFAQASALAELGAACQRAGLSVVTFSGYDYPRLRNSAQPAWQALLGVTDLLLAGPFIKSQRDFSRPWVGSRNQEFVFLTERYRHLEPVMYSLPNQVEVQVLGAGTLRLNGMAPAGAMTRFSENLARLGLRLSR